MSTNNSDYTASKVNTDVRVPDKKERQGYRVEPKELIVIRATNGSVCGVVDSEEKANKLISKLKRRFGD